MTLPQLLGPRRRRYSALSAWRNSHCSTQLGMTLEVPAQVLYGQRSVFAREPQPAAVKRFTTDDLRAYHAMWERPDNAVLGICGDFHTDRMLQLVTRELGGWKPAPGQPATPPPVPNSAPPSPAAPPRILLLDKPGATQASVVMGELGTTLADPDVYSLDALNECASLPESTPCLTSDPQTVHRRLSTIQPSSPSHPPSVRKPWWRATPRAP
jgi:hypothetical protein